MIGDGNDGVGHHANQVEPLHRRCPAEASPVVVSAAVVESLPTEGNIDFRGRNAQKRIRRRRRRGGRSAKVRRFISATIASAYAFLLLLLASPPGVLRGVRGQGIGVGNIVDDEAFEACREHLSEADADGNSRLDRAEFLNFVNLASDGRISASSFRNLDLRLIMMFLTFSCECIYERNSLPGCCEGSDAAINVLDNFREERLIFLIDLCSESDDVITDVVDDPGGGSYKEDVPTSEPTAAPFPTAQPTPMPTYENELGVKFQYELTNDEGFDADAIMNAAGNDIKADLIAATRTIVIRTLNETQTARASTRVSAALAAGGGEEGNDGEEGRGVTSLFKHFDRHGTQPRDHDDHHTHVGNAGVRRSLMLRSILLDDDDDDHDDNISLDDGAVGVVETEETRPRPVPPWNVESLSPTVVPMTTATETAVDVLRWHENYDDVDGGLLSFAGRIRGRAAVAGDEEIDRAGDGGLGSSFSSTSSSPWLDSQRRLLSMLRETAALEDGYYYSTATASDNDDGEEAPHRKHAVDRRRLLARQAADRRQRRGRRRGGRPPSPPEARGRQRIRDDNALLNAMTSRAFYSDIAPVLITRILNDPSCPNANPLTRCLLVFSRVRLFLEEGDNRGEVRAAIVRGLRQSFQDGSFVEALQGRALVKRRQ